MAINQSASCPETELSAAMDEKLKQQVGILIDTIGFDSDAYQDWASARSPKRENAAKRGEIDMVVDEAEKQFPGLFKRLRESLCHEGSLGSPQRDNAAKRGEIDMHVAEAEKEFPGLFERLRESLWSHQSEGETDMALHESETKAPDLLERSQTSSSGQRGLRSTGEIDMLLDEAEA